MLYFAGGSSDGSLEEWQKLSQELGLGEKARFLGPVQGAALDELTARCDVGMGGLGIHRLGQSVSRPLKQREYMARGLPFFYAVNDPDMPEDESMCRRLPDDETIPDGAEILRFARESRLDAALPARMRAYAREHLGWERRGANPYWKGWRSHGTKPHLSEQLRRSARRQGQFLPDAGGQVAHRSF